MSAEVKCKHDAGFKFFALSAADLLPGVWVCRRQCGYRMNFNPERFPLGISYVHRTEGKIIKLVPSKTG